MNLNSAGGDNIIINDIDIYEQQSTNFIKTFSFTQIQSSGFDKPLEFRPLLKYADSDVSFSIDYTLRILNQNNGFQIVKKASTTSYNVKKSAEKFKILFHFPPPGQPPCPDPLPPPAPHPGPASATPTWSRCTNMARAPASGACTACSPASRSLSPSTASPPP